MTYQEMLVQIPRLSTRERLLLLEAIGRSLREDLQEAPPTGSAERLLGIIPMANPPTDEELKEDYIEYLSRKYS